MAEDLYPRDTFRRLRFFFLDGWAAVPVLLAVTHLFKPWAWFALFCSWVFLFILERMHYTPQQAVRRIKAWLLPAERAPRTRHRLRRLH